MNEIPIEKLLPQGLQDMLNAKRECMAQANDIHNEITIGKGNPEWGAPKEDVFIIKLGNKV